MKRIIDIIPLRMYRFYHAVRFFCAIVGTNGEGYYFRRSPDGCNGTRTNPAQAWLLAWDFWKEWTDQGGKYMRVW